MSDRNRSIVPYGGVERRQQMNVPAVRSHSNFPDHAIQRHSDMMGAMMQRADQFH